MKKWLFHPFTYVAGSRALIIGWAVMILTSVICVYSNVHFDGVLDMHNGAKKFPLSMYLFEQFIDWVSLVLILFAAGRIFSQSAIRFIDIAGTLALARWPLIFPALIGFGIHVPATKNMSIDELQKQFTPGMIGLSLLSIVFMIWMVALLWQAFSVSLNLKGGKAAGIFIGGLILAETISKLILTHFSII